MPVVFRLAGVISALLLASCAAPPSSQYFSLAPSALTQPAPQTGQRQAFAIRVQPVSVPAQVDRPQIVLAASGTQSLRLLNDSVWVAPLSEELRNAVSLSLVRALGVLDLGQSDTPADLPVWKIDLTVHRFDLVYGSHAGLEATWRLEPPRPEGGKAAPALLCRAQATQAVPGPGIEPLVQAQRALLQRFSDDIAADILGKPSAGGTLGNRVCAPLAGSPAD